MRPATPHLTAERRRVEPTPMMAPVMVWVVETGMPARVAPTRVIAQAVSAQTLPKVSTCPLGADLVGQSGIRPWLEVSVRQRLVDAYLSP
jgi:hypothetical protein